MSSALLRMSSSLLKFPDVSLPPSRFPSVPSFCIASEPFLGVTDVATLSPETIVAPALFEEPALDGMDVQPVLEVEVDLDVDVEIPAAVPLPEVPLPPTPLFPESFSSSKLAALLSDVTWRRCAPDSTPFEPARWFKPERQLHELFHAAPAPLPAPARALPATARQVAEYQHPAPSEVELATPPSHSAPPSQGERDGLSFGMRACALCRRAFKRVGDLNKHVRSVHEQRKPNRCPHCDMAFYQKFDLKRHVMSKHKRTGWTL